MTSAPNFTGTLDLYNGVLDESGGGMTMQAWVPAARMSCLFLATISAATLLNTDPSLVSQLRTAENEIEPYARTDQATKQQLLNPQPTSPAAAAAVDAQGNDVIGDSYRPNATLRNGENIGLEPVWPYGVITDNTVVNGDNLTALADRTALAAGTPALHIFAIAGTATPP